MGLFGNSKKKINVFASAENDLRAGEKLDAISALEQDRLELTRQMEELCRRYAKISGNKKLAKRKFKVGRAPNDWQSEYFS